VGAGDARDIPRRIVVDQQANVIIAGYTRDEGGISLNPADSLTVKYDTFGNEVWVNLFDRPETYDDTIFGDLAVDIFGDVYVTGSNNTGGLTPYNVTTIKYGADGYTLWSRSQSFDGSNNRSRGLTLDNSGNVYVAGYTSFGGGAWDFLTLKYSQVLDKDGDGIPDNIDACPAEDSTGFDVDNDGCIDTVSGLESLVATLVTEGVINEVLATSLISKIANADMSKDKDKVCTAIKQLQAFNREVRAQEGHKISVEATAYATGYADSVMTYLLAPLPKGELCASG